MIYKAEQESPNESYITYDQMNIIIAFEKLWLKIAIWIRTYIRSVIYGINAIIQDDYEKEVELYNMVDNVVFLMGSYMARGIISSSSN